MSMNYCFLCSKQDAGRFENVSEFRMPASNKPIWMVLRHLGRCVNKELSVETKSESICLTCLDKLLCYDNLMVQLLDAQNALTKELEAALNRKVKPIKENAVIKFEAEEEYEFETLSDLGNIDGKSDSRSLADSENDSMNELIILSNDTSSKKRKQRHIECEVCGAIFSTKDEFETHNLSAHDLKFYICRICDTACRSEEYLELHMNIHNGKLETECRYCPRSYTRKSNTLRHMRKHWDKKSYQCHKCGERFSLDNMLYNHLLCHEGEENPIVCPECNQTFKNSKTFKHHMTTHLKDRPFYQCNICQKSFTQRYTLKVHMQVHAPQPKGGRVVDCPQTLELPLKKDGEFRCLVCNMLCVDLDEVRRHMEMIHNVDIGENSKSSLP